MLAQWTGYENCVHRSIDSRRPVGTLGGTQRESGETKSIRGEQEAYVSRQSK